nr:MAG TPA: hypothetical protein [Caudoviricetes sp.]
MLLIYITSVILSIAFLHFREFYPNYRHKRSPPLRNALVGKQAQKNTGV